MGGVFERCGDRGRERKIKGGAREREREIGAIKKTQLLPTILAVLN